MNELSKKLAESLERLKNFQDENIVAIRSKLLERTDRERLVKHGFIKEVLRGWYIPADPDEQPGDSTPWYASYWDFCSGYLEERLGAEWCLSPEQSISLHVGDRTVPAQLLVRSPNARNKPTEFIHNTSVFDVRSQLPEQKNMSRSDNLNIYSLSAALASVSTAQFTKHPTNMRAALSMITDASEILAVLLEGGYVASAGRLAGAFRNIGRDLIADNIIKAMEAADFKIKELDPFDDSSLVKFGRRELSPYANRIRLTWASMRQSVINNFPNNGDEISDIEKYMAEVEDKYVSDAYHSLSIEGYRVTHELINLVREGAWDLEQSPQSQKHLDAMAAKGYWDAFVEVKKAVKRVLQGENVGEVLGQVHSEWYFALFGASVTAGIVKPVDLAGYRTGQVFIRKSKHTPPNRDEVRDMMPMLFDLLMEEKNAEVRIVLGHFIFVYIHPYFDGNGRMGRFIMNLMMASGGYSWIIVPVERREEYMQTLEVASAAGDIVPFTKFIASLM